MTAATDNYVGGNPPTEGVISVTTGCGRRFTLQSTDTEGDPANWPEDVYINVNITPVTRVDAVVVDDLATVTLDADVCDETTNKTTWQIILETDPPTPLLIGTFERHDK